MLNYTKVEGNGLVEATGLRENQVIIIDGEELVFQNWKPYRGRRAAYPMINLSVIRVSDGQHMRYRRSISQKVKIVGTYEPPVNLANSNPLEYKEGQLFVLGGQKVPEIYRFEHVLNASRIQACNPLDNRKAKIGVQGFDFIKVEDLPY